MSDLLNKASLVVIPSGYKEDTVYSVVPSDGSGDLSFTRASNGTRVNSAGLVEVCPWNLVEQSEDFSNAVYNKYNNITATADQTSAPNGTNTADKIGLSTASTTFPNLAQDAQYIGGQVYTFSVYFKKNTVNFGKIRLGGTAFASITNSPIFNLNTGVVVSGTGTIENVGNGWYRCTMTATADTSAAGGFAIDLPDSTGVWSGSSVYNVNDSIFAWGYQANIGSTAKPYFPTTDRLNVPRLTYQNGGGGCPSLLLEKQSTNYALSSEDFSNTTYWTVSGSMTVTANQATSPDGTQNADLLYDSGARYNFVSSPVSSYYTFSCYFKRVDVTNVKITASDYYSGDVVATFNLVALTSFSSVSGDWSNVTSKIESVGNGWYRCSVTSLRGAGGSGVAYRIECSESAKSFYAWGYQAEASSYPTSYIPTTSASATRVADACFKTGISSLIGQTEGVVFIDCVLNGTSTGGASNFGNIINTNRTASTTAAVVLTYLESTNTLRASYFNGNGTLTPIVNADKSGITMGSRVKVAFAYKSGDFALYVNGVLASANTTTFTPAGGMTDIYIDDVNIYYGYPMGLKVDEAILFKTRLTNAELASLTTI